MDDPFESSKELLSWAEEHVKAIRAQTARFHEAKPYKIIVEHDVESGYYLHKLRLLKGLPPEIRLHAFDCVSCLRATLDHAVYASAAVIQGGDPQGTKFPFGENEANARANAVRRGAKIHPAVLDVIMAFQPYKGGNRLLTSLNDLRNMKQHRMLAPVAVVATALSIRGGTWRPSGGEAVLELSPPTWDAAKHELTFLRSGRSDTHYNVEFSVGVCFDQATPFPNANAVGVFNDLGRMVCRVAGAIEAKTDEIVRR